MNRRIFFDLDGTLINSQGRLYRLFRELCPQCDWTFERYWDVKRARISQAEMLRRYFKYDDEVAIGRFHEEWMRHVEDESAVSSDFPIQGMKELLAELSCSQDLYVVTCRQRRDLAVRQLEAMGFARHLKAILATEGSWTKVDLVRSCGCSQSDCLVGDTGEDVRAARQLGVGSVVVSWGILSREVLCEYTPDVVCDTVEELKQVLTRRS